MHVPKHTAFLPVYLEYATLVYAAVRSLKHELLAQRIWSCYSGSDDKAHKQDNVLCDGVGSHATVR